jgi:hypothetical protein
MNLIFESYEHIPLTESHIKQLHRDLLKYSEKDNRQCGDYKNQPFNYLMLIQLRQHTAWNTNPSLQ